MSQRRGFIIVAKRKIGGRRITVVIQRYTGFTLCKMENGISFYFRVYTFVLIIFENIFSYRSDINLLTEILGSNVEERVNVHARV